MDSVKILGLLTLVVFVSCQRVATESGSKAAPLRPFDCGEPGAPGRANPNHCEGSWYLDGPYDLRSDMLERYYRFHSIDEDDGTVTYEANYPSVAANRFGTFALTVPGLGVSLGEGVTYDRPLRSGSTGEVKYLRDLHYHLGDGRIGMRLVPVVDRSGTIYDQDYYNYDSSKDNLRFTVNNRTGQSVYGSEEVDRLLRIAFTKGPRQFHKFVSGLSENDLDREEAEDPDYPIFAPTAFMRPEQHQGTLLDLLKQKFLKLENGITHMGAYIGQGLTRNSPYLYAEQKWWDDDHVREGTTEIIDRHQSYPTTLSAVSLEGVPQRDLNYNMVITLDILNEFGKGVEFPESYKRDKVRVINLKETFDFFRGWVDHEWVREEDPGEEFWTSDHLYEIAASAAEAGETEEEGETLAWEKIAGIARHVGLKPDTMDFDQMIEAILERQSKIPFYIKLTERDSYRTYCAEHVSLVINLGLNLVQNKQGYIDVFGATEGARLWDMVQEKYSVHFEIPRIEESQFNAFDPNFDFVPLWRLHGDIDAPTEETRFGHSMAWKPQTTADLVAAFIENYLNFTDRGMSPYYGIAAILATMPEVLSRMQITPQEFLNLVREPVHLMLKHSYTVAASPTLGELPAGFLSLFKPLREAWLRTSIETKTKLALWGTIEFVAKALKEQGLEEGFDTELVSELVYEPVLASLREDVGWIADHLDRNPTDVWDGFLKDIAPYVEDARQQPAATAIEDADKELVIQYYSPPGVLHRIASNMYPSDPHVEIVELLTVMPADELCLTGRSQTVYDPLEDVASSGGCDDAVSGK